MLNLAIRDLVRNRVLRNRVRKNRKDIFFTVRFRDKHPEERSTVRPVNAYSAMVDFGSSINESMRRVFFVLGSLPHCPYSSVSVLLLLLRLLLLLVSVCFLRSLPTRGLLGEAQAAPHVFTIGRLAIFRLIATFRFIRRLHSSFSLPWFFLLHLSIERFARTAIRDVTSHARCRSRLCLFVGVGCTRCRSFVSDPGQTCRFDVQCNLLFS